MADFFAYAKGAGMTVDATYRTTVTLENGDTHEGTMTIIRDSHGDIRSGYFEPDTSSNIFEVGYIYNLGNGAPSTSGNSSSTPGPLYIGTGGQIVGFESQFPDSGGGSTYTPSNSQTLTNLLGLNGGESIFLNGHPEIANAIKTYLHINGYSVDNKGFGKWAVGYLSKPENNITLEEFEIKYGLKEIIVPNNGIDLENAPESVTTGTYPIIGRNTNRNNVEDMTYGTNHDASGIGQDILNRSNEELWSSMQDLMDWGTTSDSPLRQVAYSSMNKFKNNTTTQTEMVDPILNNRVEISPAFAKFLKEFGGLLRTELQKSNGNFSNMVPIELERIRPIFGGFNNIGNGLTILLNDTEQSTVRLESYSRTGNKMNIVVEVTIKDHFGLDKHDAVSKDFFRHGFQSWWVLQHRKGFIPFNTKVTVRKTLIINL